MARLSTYLFVFSLLLGIAALGPESHAQVCREASGSDVPNVSAANVDCDMSYRDTVVTCEKVGSSTTVGTRPSCPAKPMPMLTTPQKPVIGVAGVNGYSSYILAYPRDGADRSKPYAGNFYRGTGGDQSQSVQMFGNTANVGGTAVKRLAACVNQIKPNYAPTNVDEEAKMVRLQMDNCTNQYILNASLYPFQQENSKIYAMEDPDNPSKRTELNTECQPLRTWVDTENEYLPSKFIQDAWIKLLQNPDHRVNPISTQIPGIPTIPGMGDLLPLTTGIEPHLPTGVGSLASPIAPPSPFPEITLTQISSVPYETIMDPSHPFSPRWNYIMQDRTYSPITSGYMTSSDNAVFCAGVREAPNEQDDKKKKDLEVKVDVLEFRRPAFQEGLFNRVAFNYLCQSNGGAFPEGTNGEFFSIISNAWCVTPYFTGFPPVLMAIAHDCQTCFGTSFPTDDQNNKPPCTTNYLGKDLKISGYVPGLRNGFNRTASCTATGLYRDTKYNMDKLCRDIRKPYTQINRLKMRYHNPDDENDPDGQNVVLKNGVLEGLKFSDYFDNRMPYPRMWETGRPLLKVAGKDSNDQPPMDTTGQYSAFVGVGRESAPGAPSDEAVKKHPDERCMIGGWGTLPGGINPPVSFAGMTLNVPDPLTSWTELKLYQSRSLRMTGMNCLARYEKVFKSGSSENMVLKALGAETSRALIAICPKNSACTSTNTEYKTAKEFKDMGGVSGLPSDKKAITQLLPESIPLSWRGYIADPDTDKQFPNFGGSGSMLIGLDRAELGDIVMLPFGGTNNVLKPGLAKVGMVVEVHNTNCDTSKDCYVKVREADNGKWPDVCGTTDAWGEMKDRYLYKPGHLPDAAQKEYERIQSSKSCEETRISRCEAENWNTIQLYRVRNDQRSGCDKEKSADCAS